MAGGCHGWPQVILPWDPQKAWQFNFENKPCRVRGRPPTRWYDCLRKFDEICLNKLDGILVSPGCLQPETGLVCLPQSKPFCPSLWLFGCPCPYGILWGRNFRLERAACWSKTVKIPIDTKQGGVVCSSQPSPKSMLKRSKVAVPTFNQLDWAIGSQICSGNQWNSLRSVAASNTTASSRLSESPRSWTTIGGRNHEIWWFAE